MVELLEELYKLLQQVPLSVAIFATDVIIIFIVREQLKVNKKHQEFQQSTEKRLQSGTTNFSMIDNHFLKISEHFNKIHDEMQAMVRTVNRRTDRIEKAVLKDIIYNESMELSERQEAYDQYVGLGENGMVKEYYHAKLLPLIKECVEKK